MENLQEYSAFSNCITSHEHCNQRNPAGILGGGIMWETYMIPAHFLILSSCDSGPGRRKYVKYTLLPRDPITHIVLAGGIVHKTYMIPAHFVILLSCDSGAGRRKLAKPTHITDG